MANAACLELRGTLKAAVREVIRVKGKTNLIVRVLSLEQGICSRKLPLSANHIDHPRNLLSQL